MRILLIISILMALCHLAQSQTVSQCNANYVPLFPGQICTNTSFPVCEHGFTCQNNTANLAGKPFCQAITNLQTPCNFTSQCTGVGLACIMNVCGPKRWAGEGCSINDQCLSLNCNNGTCQGYTNGSMCVASYDNYCGPELFCQFNNTFFANSTAVGFCTPVLQPGQPCTVQIGYGIIMPRPLTDIASVCAAGSLCDVTTGVCQMIGSVNTTASAATNKASCNFTSGVTPATGVAFQSGVGCVSYCGTGPNDPQCLTGYYCNCPGNGNNGTCAPDPCAKQKTAIVQCMNASKCRDLWLGPDFQSLIWRSLANGTCVYNNCQQRVWDYECCLTNYGTRADLTPGVSCGNFIQNTNFPNQTVTPIQSVSSTLSSCFLLLLSVVFFIFVVYL